MMLFRSWDPDIRLHKMINMSIYIPISLYRHMSLRVPLLCLIHPPGNDSHSGQVTPFLNTVCARAHVCVLMRGAALELRLQVVESASCICNPDPPLPIGSFLSNLLNSLCLGFLTGKG